MSRLTILACFAALASATACAPAPAAPVTPEAAAPVKTAEVIPAAVNGWREHQLRDGVITIQPRAWRADTIKVPVKAGEGLEYKVAMKAGEGMVYNISYENLEHPGMMVVEFHGHTPQVDGVGDLMFYSKTGGSPESGAFTAPWTGIHGWYFKNDSAKDVVAKLQLAGFYDLNPN